MSKMGDLVNREPKVLKYWDMSGFSFGLIDVNQVELSGIFGYTRLPLIASWSDSDNRIIVRQGWVGSFKWKIKEPSWPAIWGFGVWHEALGGLFYRHEYPINPLTEGDTLTIVEFPNREVLRISVTD